MITKGIVEEILDYKAKVRLPIYDGTASSNLGTKSSQLSSATICSLSNIKSPVQVGDIVWVGFEDNDDSKPIILGHLYKSTPNISYAGLQLSTLDTKSTTKLYKDTYIGNIKPNEIAMLTGLKGNIQSQLNLLEEKTKLLDGNLDGYLPLSGGSMTGEIKLGQGDGYGIQLGTDGRINGTTNEGSTTATVLGLIKSGNKSNCYIGHNSFPITIRSELERPIYIGKKNNQTYSTTLSIKEDLQITNNDTADNANINFSIDGNNYTKTINNVAEASHAASADNATIAQYASEDQSKGTIEQRLTRLGFKRGGTVSSSAEDWIPISFSSSVSGYININNSSIYAYRQGNYIYLRISIIPTDPNAWLSLCSNYNDIPIAQLPNEFAALTTTTAAVVTTLNMTFPTGGTSINMGRFPLGKLIAVRQNTLLFMGHSGYSLGLHASPGNLSMNGVGMSISIGYEAYYKSNQLN